MLLVMVISVVVFLVLLSNECRRVLLLFQDEVQVTCSSSSGSILSQSSSNQLNPCHTKQKTLVVVDYRLDHSRTTMTPAKAFSLAQALLPRVTIPGSIQRKEIKAPSMSKHNKAQQRHSRSSSNEMHEGDLGEIAAEGRRLNTSGSLHAKEGAI